MPASSSDARSASDSVGGAVTQPRRSRRRAMGPVTPASASDALSSSDRSSGATCWRNRRASASAAAGLATPAAARRA
eukprot:129772-Chlamydomonas_euryale.AAC.1